MEKDADAVIWCCDEAPGFSPSRPRDKTVVANIVDAMVAYAEGRLGPLDIKLSEIDRVIAIGPDGMMAAVARARHGLMAPFLKRGHRPVASINSPPQCLVKRRGPHGPQVHPDPEAAG